MKKLKATETSKVIEGNILPLKKDKIKQFYIVHAKVPGRVRIKIPGLCRYHNLLKHSVISGQNIVLTAISKDDVCSFHGR